MKRKFLEDMELSKEQIDSIMAENGKDIESAKGDKESLEKEIESLKGQVSDRDKQLETLKKSTGDVDELKKQIETLQGENKAKDAEYHQLKVNAAVDKALSAAKAKNTIAVKALLKDLDKAEFADDGTIKGLADQISALQKGDDTKFLFDVETKKGASIKGATPAASGDDKPEGITKEQFQKMTYRERVKLFETDRETYDALSGNTNE